MLVLTTVLAMPATNTGLLLMDPYLTARSFSTPLTLFALAGLLERKYLRAGAAILAYRRLSPQMVAYLVFLAFVLWGTDRSSAKVRERVPALAAGAGMLPHGLQSDPSQRRIS